MPNENDQGAGEVREFRTPTGPLADEMARVAEANRRAGHAPAPGPMSTVLPPERPGTGVSIPPSQQESPSSTASPAAPVPPIASGVTGFSGIDLRDGVVVADNGEVFRINKQGILDLTVFCFNVMVSAQQDSAKALAKALQLPMKKEEPDDGGDADLSNVSGEQAPPSVPGEPEANGAS